jgi:hypothetical protein
VALSSTDFVQLPADSTGKKAGMKAATIGGATIYLPAAVIYDESGNAVGVANSALRVADVGTRVLLGAYRCGSSAFVAGLASAQNLLSIENPSASGVTVAIKRVEIQGVFASTTASATAFLYHVGRTTAIPSAGTALTAQKHQTTDAAPKAIVRTAPTATAATGDLWTTAPGTGSSNSPAMLPVPLFAESRESDDLLLAAGEALLVRADTNTTNWRHSVDVSWEEY